MGYTFENTFYSLVNVQLISTFIVFSILHQSSFLTQFMKISKFFKKALILIQISIIEGASNWSFIRQNFCGLLLFTNCSKFSIIFHGNITVVNKIIISGSKFTFQLWVYSVHPAFWPPFQKCFMLQILRANFPFWPCVYTVPPAFFQCRTFQKCVTL